MVETLQFWTVTMLLAICLSACAGIRAFLPLFVVGLGFRFGLGTLDQTAPGLVWITSDLALWVLGIATVLEIAADKVPVVDSVVDSFGMVFRPVGGAAAVFAVLGAAEPKAAIALSVTAALLITLPIQAVKMGLRALTHATTGGVLSPALSALEDATVVVGSILAMLAPVLAVVLVAVALFYGGRRFLRLRRARAEQPVPA